MKRGTVYVWAIGIGLLTSFGSIFIVSTSIELAIAELAGFALLIYGLVGVTRQLFRSAPDHSIQHLVTATDPLVVVEQDGLYRIGGNYEQLLWWEKPPRLVLDTGLREMPFLREFELWRGATRMRLIRRRTAGRRWSYRILFQYADYFGLTFLWFLITKGRIKTEVAPEATP